MAGTGADLENSSIQWVDKLEALGDGTKTAQNAILANSVEQMLGELRKSYTKLADEKAKDPNSRAQVYTSQQLANRIENTIELLPSWKRKELPALDDSELKKADRMGRDQQQACRRHFGGCPAGRVHQVQPAERLVANSNRRRRGGRRRGDR